MNKLKFLGLLLCLLAGKNSLLAQPDYAPAHWNPAYSGHWYTTGNGHSLVVIHDMEGYYESVISYFQQSSTSADAHYLVNSLQNGSIGSHSENNPADVAAGDITQMVREQYYAWHAVCLNRYSFGTEHEGFADQANPNWYSDDMYQASALLQRHLCDTYGIPKDRFHIVGHGEHNTNSWVYWMAYNFPAIDPACNTHYDPGKYWDWNKFMQMIKGTNSPPIIGIQPFNYSVAQGSNVLFQVSAAGDYPLRYQWRKNGANIANATASSYPLSNVQAANAGLYSVVITNTSGAITSSVVTLKVNVPQNQQVVFADNLDADTSANWNLYQGSDNNVSDYTATWAYDYTSATYTFDGTNAVIPVAPSTTNGVKRGLKLTVNKNDAVAANAGVSLYPKNQSFSGNFTLLFDMWMNYNGNSGGGSGSTEFTTFGINHTGNRVNWGAGSASVSDGLWFAMTGEGGAASNYRAYVGNPSGNPIQLAFDAGGFTSNGYPNLSPLATIYQTTFYENLFPASAYETPGFPGKHWIQVELSQLNNVVTWKMNNVVVAQRTNTTAYTSGDIMLGYMDIFNSIASPPGDNYVIFDNVRVLGQAVAPAIATQPASKLVNRGANATFSVAATGTAPLSYQWRFNGAVIPGATGSSYTVTNVQSSNAGVYYVIVTNLAGTVTSSIVTLGSVEMKVSGVALNNGAVNLTINGAAGSGYTILTSTNLVNWTPLVTLVNTNGTLQYSDPILPSTPRRFYKISAPQ